MNVKYFIMTALNFILLFIALIMIAGCIHDNKVLRDYNEQLRQSMLDLRQETNETKSEVRQVKTNSDIVLRIVTEGMFLEEE